MEKKFYNLCAWMMKPFFKMESTFKGKNLIPKVYALTAYSSYSYEFYSVLSHNLGRSLGHHR